MTREFVSEKLIGIVAQSLQIPAAGITLQSRFLTDLNAESIDILDIKFAVEQQFGFKFNNQEIRDLIRGSATAQNLTEKELAERFTVGSFFDYIIFKKNIA